MHRCAVRRSTTAQLSAQTAKILESRQKLLRPVVTRPWNRDSSSVCVAAQPPVKDSSVVPFIRLRSKSTEKRTFPESMELSSTPDRLQFLRIGCGLTVVVDAHVFVIASGFVCRSNNRRSYEMGKRFFYGKELRSRSYIRS